MRKGFGEIGDSRLVIMTAITVADELFEAKSRIAELEAALAEGEANQERGEAMRDSLAAEVAASLDATSERIERLVHHLNTVGKS